MPLPQEKKYSIDVIYALADGERAELIDGYIYYMAPPSTKHQRISGKLFNSIANYIDLNNGTCEPFISPFAVFLKDNEITYVEPDTCVICDRDKITDQGCNGAPDWIIEIVSPSSRRMDYSTKLFKYRTAGVREYWIVDTDKDRVTVYYFENDFMEEYSLSDKVKVYIFDNFEIDFSIINII